LNTTHKRTIDVNSICTSPDNQPTQYRDSVQTENGQSYPVLQVYDALYYLGANQKWKTDDARSIDTKYWTELDRRSRIVWGEGIGTKYLNQ